MVLRHAACLLVASAWLPALALAEEPATILSVSGDPARAYDEPRPQLDLAPKLSDGVAGLAPGQDLGGTPVPMRARLAAADLDSYRNTQEYRQLISHYAPKKPLGTGKQLGGLKSAAIRAAALLVKKAVVDRLREDVEERIEAGTLPPVADTALEAAHAASSIAIVATDVK